MSHNFDLTVPLIWSKMLFFKKTLKAFSEKLVYDRAVWLSDLDSVFSN